jgi:hypothetical protein
MKISKSRQLNAYFEFHVNDPEDLMDPLCNPRVSLLRMRVDEESPFVGVRIATCFFNSMTIRLANDKANAHFGTSIQGKRPG